MCKLRFYSEHWVFIKISFEVYLWNDHLHFLQNYRSVNKKYFSRYSKKKIFIFWIFSLSMGWSWQEGIYRTSKANYEQIVYWKKNLLLLSSERASRSFSEDTVRLLNSQIEGAAWKNMSFKAVMIMPSLLWQKPSKKSRLKDHLVALKRRRSCRKGYYMKERRVKMLKRSEIKKEDWNFINEICRLNEEGKRKCCN